MPSLGSEKVAWGSMGIEPAPNDHQHPPCYQGEAQASIVGAAVRSRTICDRRTG